MIDACGRMIRYLRISITDRCNLRCVYCMSEHGVVSLGHTNILTYEEFLRVTRLMAQLGVDSVRITGGETTVRNGWMDFIRELKEIHGIRRISMTTNGILLAPLAREAKEAGLDSVNISLDTLNPEAFHRITRLGNVEDVLRSIDACLDAGIQVKLNAVPSKELNSDNLTCVAELARDRDICVRFIELMPVGFGETMTPIPTDEVQKLMEKAFGSLSPDTVKHGDGPAVYVKPNGFVGSIGFISAVSHEFCESCNRVRVTADGVLKLCLNHTGGISLRDLMRGGASDAEILSVLKDAIAKKPLHHGFNENIGDREDRRMNQIGG